MSVKFPLPRRLRARFSLAALATLAACTAATALRAQSYTAIDLGGLSGDYAEADGINNSGQIVGYGYNASGSNSEASTTALLYSVSINGIASITSLGSLGGTFNFADGINNAGVIAGYAQATGATPPNYAVSYPATGGAPTVLGAASGTNNQAYAINSAGQAVGISNASGNIQATLFPSAGGAATNLGTLGGSSSQATAINDAGQAVGYGYTTGNAANRAALFSTTGSAATTLGVLPGGTNSYAYGINNAGTVVGASLTAANAAAHAVIFPTSGAAPTDLGTLGGTNSYAYGVNAAGQIVGNSNYVGGGDDTHAFVYTAAGGLQDINNLIPASSTVSDIGVSGVGNQINDWGQIVGLGIDAASGNIHAVLLNPVNPLTSIAGAAQDTRLVGGMAYAKTAAFANPTTLSLRSTVAFLGGTAGTGGTAAPGTFGLNRNLVTTFTNATLSIRTASDVVNVAGSGTDTFTLQLSYNQALATTTLGGENNAMLFWRDPSDGTYKLAVADNTGGTPQFIVGAYDPATDFVLGYYGVDPTTHTAWAVLNHDGDFVVSTSGVPEPSSAVGALLALVTLGGGWLARSRRARAA